MASKEQEALSIINERFDYLNNGTKAILKPNNSFLILEEAINDIEGYKKTIYRLSKEVISLVDDLELYKKALNNVASDYLNRAMNSDNAFLFPFRETDEMVKAYLEGFSFQDGALHKIRGCDVWCNLDCKNCKKRL